MSSSSPHSSLSDNQSRLSGSKLRKLLPALGLNSEGASSDSSQGLSLQPRPLPRANLTKIACKPCRKRKAKCCGDRPKCKACINRGLECHYQASDQDLLDLMRKHDEIQEKISKYERICSLLMNLPEQDSHAVLSRLRAGPDVAAIIPQVEDGDFLPQLALTPGIRLCKGQAVENLSDWLRGVLPSGSGGLSAVSTPGSYNASLGDTSAFTPTGGTSRDPSCFLNLGLKDITSSNTGEKAMDFSDDRQGPPQYQIAPLAEGMQNSHMHDELPRFHGLDHVLFALDQRE